MDVIDGHFTKIVDSTKGFDPSANSVRWLHFNLLRDLFFGFPHSHIFFVGVDLLILTKPTIVCKKPHIVIRPGCGIQSAVGDCVRRLGMCNLCLASTATGCEGSWLHSYNGPSKIPSQSFLEFAYHQSAGGEQSGSSCGIECKRIPRSPKCVERLNDIVFRRFNSDWVGILFCWFHQLVCAKIRGKP